MALQPPSTQPLIPGYEVQERIGTGGYGEVWSAVAPGAIRKAVKFVYGFHDDDRARRELKALNRIKEVRHPFLLSLDRIEVLDGQLVIVMELAEKSLKDRFQECQQSGAAGIPRAELLVYVRDAAEALDYMTARCSLQHLDIKPENLLLVGGRVKVADFGLVRDVHNVSASLMGGLTPVYAPPELFEGRPGLRSDQYSLAIVYQEMLTGTVPFSGATAAQLMAQHLHDRPHISALPPADQATIARALSKETADRFPSCRTMVDGLRAAVGVARARPAATPVPDAQAEAHAARGQTRAVPARVVSEGQPVESPPPSSRTVQVAAVAVETMPDATDLSPVELNEQEVTFRPTLFLGIGGTAARTLRRLRRRLSERFADLRTIPAFQMLLIDTDLKQIVAATQGDSSAALTPAETLAMPLRRTQEYRADTDRFLSWLSRRWLYNIPRSLQPEGRRPLGRVALVDHAQRAFDRIRTALTAALSPDAIAMSTEAMGRPFDGTAPRVFLIASISGGTGSGMVLDLAYAVRKILVDQGLRDDGVRGILMHSTGRELDARDLAIANAYAFLQELHHCSHPSLAYPGAPECGIGSFGEDDATFPHAYLVHLGNRLSEAELNAAVEQVAQYLYLDAATPTGTLLEKIRAQGHNVSPSGSFAPRLRSFGLCQIGGSYAGIASMVVDRLCSDLINRWYGSDPLSGRYECCSVTDCTSVDVPVVPAGGQLDADTQALAVQRIDQLGLKIKPLLEHVAQILEDHLGEDVSTYCSGRLQQTLDAAAPLHGGTAQPDQSGRLLSAVDAIVAAAGVAMPQQRSSQGPPRKGFYANLNRYAENRAHELRAWVLGRIDVPGARLPTAYHAANWLTEHLHQLESRADEMLEVVRRRVAQMAQAITDSEATNARSRRRRSQAESDWNPSAALVKDLTEYLSLRFQEQLLAGMRHVIRTLACDVAGVSDSLLGLRRELVALAGQFDAGPVGRTCPTGFDTDSDAAGNVDGRVAEQLRQLWPRIVTRFEQKLDREILPRHGGLAGALAPGAKSRGHFAALLQREARGMISQTLTEVNFADVLLAEGAEQEAAPPQLRASLGAAVPRLLDIGASRLLVALRKGTDLDQFQRMVQRVTDHSYSTALGDDGDVVFCYEVERLLPSKVAAELTERGTDYAAIASRLHTRVDVAWTPLD